MLPRLIDATRNAIIARGAFDMVLLSNETLLAIQNMTWGGERGFQTRPDRPFYVPRSSLADTYETVAASGMLGSYAAERDLTYIGVALAGRMIPQYARSLGRIPLTGIPAAESRLAQLHPALHRWGAAAAE